jgi:hypothetical protein
MFCFHKFAINKSQNEMLILDQHHETRSFQVIILEALKEVDLEKN